MKKRNVRNFSITIGLFLLFVLFTIAIRTLDVRPIGPKESMVGFAGLNGWFHEMTGVHMKLYKIIDYAQIIPFLLVAGFGLLGLVQLIKRRNLFKVDSSILMLGGFYLLVMGAYVFFECFVINYRPVIIEGVLEASYPSSTTMLVLCVMTTAIMQLKSRINNRSLYRVVKVLMIIFIVLMTVGRLISGVHWITDIIGGILLSAFLVMLYYSCNKLVQSNK